MSRSPGWRPVGRTNEGAIFLLSVAPEPTPHAVPRPPVEVFTSERVAREAFVRRRLEVGSGSAWAQLVAVEDQAIRPICWFGCSPKPLPASRSRTQRARRRWALAALALSFTAVTSMSAGVSERADTGLVPDVSKSAQVTATASQRAGAAAVNTSGRPQVERRER